MFDDLKQNFLKWGITKFTTLREEFNFLGDSNIAPRHKVERAAETALPYIKPFTGWTGKAKIAAASVAAYHGLGWIKPEHLQEASDLLRGVSKQEIRTGLEDMISKGATPQNAKKSVEGVRDFLKAFPEEVQISTAEAVDAALPPQLKALLFELWEYNTAIPVADRIRQWRAEIDNMSDADLEKKLLGSAKNSQLEVDILTDATYEIMQKCTPQALALFVDHLKADLSSRKINAFLSTGVSFADEFCTAAKDGKLEDITSSKRGPAFAAEAHVLTSALENAFIAAGLVPDNNPLAAYKKALAAQQAKQPKPPKGPNGP